MRPAGLAPHQGPGAKNTATLIENASVASPYARPGEDSSRTFPADLQRQATPPTSTRPATLNQLVLERTRASAVVRRREPQTSLCPLTSQQPNAGATTPKVSEHIVRIPHIDERPQRGPGPLFRCSAQWPRRPGYPAQGQQHKRPDKFRRADAGFAPVRPLPEPTSKHKLWSPQQFLSNRAANFPVAAGREGARVDVGWEARSSGAWP